MSLKIGAWLYSENSSTLKYENIDRELEPLIANLLAYFISKPMQVISREELIKNVWKLTYVDDNSINRAISELRKQLKLPDSNEMYLKTHYRKGYSLTVQPTQVSNENTSQRGMFLESQQSQNNAKLYTQTSEHNTEPKTTSKARSIYSYIATAVLIISAICFTYFYSIPDSNANNQGLQHGSATAMEIDLVALPASWQQGVEYFSVISPDKSKFAYINIFNGERKPFVKSLSSNISTEIVFEDYSVSPLSWQHKTQILLTMIMHKDRNECFYATFDINNEVAPTFIEKIDRCEIGRHGYAQLIPQGNGLYYVEKDKEYNHIKYKNLETGSERVIIPSYNLYPGVSKFKLSADGSILAYQLDSQGNASKIYLHDTETAENSLLYEFQKEDYLRWMRYFDWYEDGKSLAWLTDDSIDIFNIQDKSLKRLKHNAKISLSYLSILAEDQALVSQSIHAEEKIEIYDFNFKPIDMDGLQSDAKNIYPTFVNDSFYFVSSRTGEYLFWNIREELKPISALKPYTSYIIYPPAVSSDESLMLGQLKDKLYLVDLEKDQVRNIEFNEGEFVNYAVIGPNNRYLYVTLTKNREHDIWKYDLVTNQKEIVVSNVTGSLLSHPSGEVYYTQDNNLIRLSDSKLIPVDAELDVYQVLMSLSDNYFYIYDGKKIIKTELSSGISTSIDVPFPITQISVNRDDTRIAVVRRDYGSSQLYRLSW